MKHANQFLQSLLALSLAAVCSGAVATESGVEGKSTTSNTFIDSINWNDLVNGSITVTPDGSFPAGGTYNCAVTCAATFINPKDPGTDTSYYLGLGTAPDAAASASWQVISFPQATPDIDDVEWGPVTTTHAFKSLSGSKTFYCLARKFVVDDPDVTVENAKITASCSDYAW